MRRPTSHRSLSSIRSLILLVSLTGALAACGGAPTKDVDLAGSWTGTWVSANDATGGVIATFTQTQGVLSGTVEISGSPCITTGTIEGTVTGSNVAFGAVSGVDTINFTAQLGTDTMSGTFSVPAGACAGTGTFQMSRIN